MLSEKNLIVGLLSYINDNHQNIFHLVPDFAIAQSLIAFAQRNNVNVIPLLNMQDTVHYDTPLHIAIKLGTENMHRLADLMIVSGANKSISNIDNDVITTDQSIELTPNLNQPMKTIQNLNQSLNQLVYAYFQCLIL